MKHQPLQMIDCQRELLGIVPSQQKRIDRLKAQRLALIIFSVGGWSVAAIIIWLRFSGGVQ